MSDKPIREAVAHLIRRLADDGLPALLIFGVLALLICGGLLDELITKG